MLDQVVQASERVPGWTRGNEARFLASLVYALPEKAIVVELGSFLGSGAVLMGSVLKLRSSGVLHCIDPFDGSGDSFSVPHYAHLVNNHPGHTQRQIFDNYVQQAGVKEWIRVHQGTAESVAQTWQDKVDLIYMDGDQSPAGARSAYEAWASWLKPGGIIAIHNSNERVYDADHDGQYRVARSRLVSPSYSGVCCIDATTFARRNSTGSI